MIKKKKEPINASLLIISIIMLILTYLPNFVNYMFHKPALVNIKHCNVLLTKKYTLAII